MRLYKKLVSSIIILFSLFLATIPGLVRADTPTGPTATAITNYTTLEKIILGGQLSVPLENVVANVIGIVLSIIGLVFIVLIIYGGYLWGTARGNEEKVESGRKLIFEATIGTIIIFGAYFLTAFVIQQVGYATIRP